MGDRGHNRHEPKSRGLLCPFQGRAESSSNTMSPGPRPTSVSSGILIHPAVSPQYTVSQKTSHRCLAITLTRMNGFWYFFAGMLPIKQAIKRRFIMPPQVTCASALPGKTGKRKNHIFTQLDCVIHTMHLCAVFLKEKVVICDVFDSI